MRDRLRQRGFADAGQVFDKAVAARNQATDRQAHLLRFAQNNGFDRADGLVEIGANGGKRRVSRIQHG